MSANCLSDEHRRHDPLRALVPGTIRGAWPPTPRRRRDVVRGVENDHRGGAHHEFDPAPGHFTSARPRATAASGIGIPASRKRSSAATATAAFWRWCAPRRLTRCSERGVSPVCRCLRDPRGSRCAPSTGARAPARIHRGLRPAQCVVPPPAFRVPRGAHAPARRVIGFASCPAPARARPPATARITACAAPPACAAGDRHTRLDDPRLLERDRFERGAAAQLWAVVRPRR